MIAIVVFNIPTRPVARQSKIIRTMTGDLSVNSFEAGYVEHVGEFRIYMSPRGLYVVDDSYNGEVYHTTTKKSSAYKFARAAQALVEAGLDM